MKKPVAVPLLSYLLLVVTLNLSSYAFAAEIHVQAPVVNVEPITGPGEEIEECPPKPDNGLAATLGWDLGLTCTTRTIESDRVDAYRVFYRWDDRVYSQVMQDRPGSSIALTLKIN